MSKVKLSKSRRLALLFFVGTIFFAIGLVVIPNVTIEIIEGSPVSPFLIIGLVFFIVGSYLGFRK